MAFGPPLWLHVEEVDLDHLATVSEDLDPGEREAIALATVLDADLLLIDEQAGRLEARRRNMRVTGTLGVLRTAAAQNLINVPEVISRLRATSFYVEEALIEVIFGEWLHSQ